MIHRVTIFLLILVLPLFACSREQNKSVADRESTTLEFNFSRDLANADIGEICCNTAEHAFNSGGDQLPMMPGSNPVWIQLPNIPDSELLLISHPVDSAQLYEYLATESRWLVSVTGDSVPRSGNALRVPDMAFQLNPQHDPAVNRYLKISQPTRITLSIEALSHSVYRNELNRHFLLRCFLLGFVLAIVLYNLVLTIITRYIVFALNALTVSSLITVDLYLTGFGALYLWPVDWSNTILNLSLSMVVIAGSAFIYLFMHPAPENMINTRWLLVPASIAAFTLLISWFFPYWLIQTMLIISIGLFVIITTSVVVNHYFRGSERALPIMIPLLFVMVPGGIAVYLRRTGLLPEHVTGVHILELTLALEALVFSLALGTRILFLSRDADAARRERDVVTLDSARNYSKLQDRERARIASDLHDSIGHDLVMMKSYLTRSDKDQLAIDHAQQLATNTLATVRRIAHQLHPVVVDMVGWHRAVKDLFRELGSTLGIEVQINDINHPPTLPKSTQAHLYQILQEVSSNILKHSGATRCEISLSSRHHALVVQVHDNGKGHSGDNEGLGLFSISQRVLAFNGDWSIKGDEATGTTFSVTVPLENRDD